MFYEDKIFSSILYEFLNMLVAYLDMNKAN